MFNIRGRYIQVSKLEDCRRWRIVVLCKLANISTNETKFARLNMLWQCLEEPCGDSDQVWSQWGVLHTQILTPGTIRCSLTIVDFSIISYRKRRKIFIFERGQGETVRR